jgi:hypothetical protein
MRASPLLLAIALACSAAPARGVEPVPVVVRNVGRGTTRVQVATWSGVLPCDSRENTLLFDGLVRQGETHVFAVPLGTIQVCARSTTAGSTLDWGPSEWRGGGVRCSGPRRRWCVADPTLPIHVDVGG